MGLYAYWLIRPGGLFGAFDFLMKAFLRTNVAFCHPKFRNEQMKVVQRSNDIV